MNTIVSMKDLQEHAKCFETTDDKLRVWRSFDYYAQSIPIHSILLFVQENFKQFNVYDCRHDRIICSSLD